MTKVRARAYTSPTLVLLCFDWADGDKHPDFLGFSIKRSPGYGKSGAPQYLYNKLDFTPPKSGAKPKLSNRAPIQKFNWWDGGIGPSDAGKTFTYTITPVLGTGPSNLQEQQADAIDLKVKLPETVEGGIGSYFNRAVVSSQSFLSIAKKSLNAQMTWLANGIENAVPDFLSSNADHVAGAIYHLTDQWKIIPAMKKYKGQLSFSYFLKTGSKGDEDSKPAADLLANGKRIFTPRSKISSLMHDKFIVGFNGGAPTRVLMGSMNFTPEAQTVQANVLHTFESKQMAALYANRHDLLLNDPTTAATAKGTLLYPGSQWKSVTDIPDSKIRIFFSPEKTKSRVSIDTIIQAVSSAKSSVVFALFSPTDKPLLDALLAAGDQGKIMLGLLNSISNPESKAKKAGKPLTASQQVAVTVYHRSRKDKKVIPFGAFSKNAPRSFLPELKTIDTSSFSAKQPGGKIPPVHVHHKFVVIDADTANPIIYTGSQNLSVNSVSKNDENLLEIKGNTALAAVYFAEFMRLYNHYRARAVWEAQHGAKAKGSKSAHDPLVLKVTRDEWVNEAYKKGTAEYAARTRLA
ncbi:phospholipase D-like domain-containing protein [Paraburkholderia sp. Cpub6]|uniref:phospholipase D-like domain-containing protein n=1 Tax=Paraburkholderia sp. Cpub6 TaxID=2723094 RepID=UPI00160BC1A6|nr:phospholipase D-like domain-containing protein [Paraburkholderia sp. Cpub6]MBB5463540.1 phosphatidylserine/phosphatidylglycerophosphate/cardiolipin synthase-like enzyme [Paraburkholderia sp. Cpub6]